MSDQPTHPLEDQAVDYVLGHLDGAARVQFVQAMEKDSALQKLVSELSESASAMVLALAADAAPESIRSATLARIAAQPQDKGASVIAQTRTAKKRSVSAGIGWALAAGFAVLGVLQYRLHQGELAERTEVYQAQLLEKDKQVQILEAKSASDRTALEQALSSANGEVETARKQLADLRVKSAEQLREKEAILAKALAERDQFAASHKLANMQIATLQATLAEYKEGVAVVVWNAEKKEGLLKLEKMPPIPANKDFQLWVVDPAYKNPVDGGVIQVDDKGFAKVEFKPQLDVTKVDKFAISVEKKGGVPVAEGPIVLLSN